MFPIERLEVGDHVVTDDGRAAKIAKTHRGVAKMTPGTIARTHDGSLVTVTRITRVVSGSAHDVFNLSLERDIAFFANGKLVEAPRASRVLNGHSLLASY